MHQLSIKLFVKNREGVQDAVNMLLDVLERKYEKASSQFSFVRPVGVVRKERRFSKAELSCFKFVGRLIMQFLTVSTSFFNSVEVIVIAISYLYYMVNDLHNLRGQSPIAKPDAANPRQVDAFVKFNFPPTILKSGTPAK